MYMEIPQEDDQGLAHEAFTEFFYHVLVWHALCFGVHFVCFSRILSPGIFSSSCLSVTHPSRDLGTSFTQRIMIITCPGFPWDTPVIVRRRPSLTRMKPYPCGTKTPRMVSFLFCVFAFREDLVLWLVGCHLDVRRTFAIRQPCLFLFLPIQHRLCFLLLALTAAQYDNSDITNSSWLLFITSVVHRHGMPCVLNIPLRSQINLNDCTRLRKKPLHVQ